MNPKTMQSRRVNDQSNRKAPSKSGPRRLGGAGSTVAYQCGDILEGKYELVSQLGEGSMGSVWLAINQALDLPVAIKLLRSNVSREDEDRVPSDVTAGFSFEEHLLREAQAMAKVSHPSVVRIFDFGVSDRKTPFIVMECLEGEDLREKLNRDGFMTPESAVQLLLPVIHGMQAAHVLGVVHRDLKPENIFLTRSEDGIAPKVLDFGIADMGWMKNGLGSLVCGTPDYMAPEQLSREPKPDHRADIWSMCAVLYEAISGHPPNREKRQSKDWLELDAQLIAIVERGLATHPRDRWRSMGDLGEALAEWLVARGIDLDCQGLGLRARWLYGRDSGSGIASSTPLPSTLSAPTVVAPKPLFDTVVSTKGLAADGSSPSKPVVAPVPEITMRSAQPISAQFPEASELGPIVIPKNRLGAWLVVAGALAALAGGAYFMRGALGFSHSAQASEDPSAVVASDDAALPAAHEAAALPPHPPETARADSRLAIQLAPSPMHSEPRKSAHPTAAPTAKDSKKSVVKKGDTSADVTAPASAATIQPDEHAIPVVAPSAVAPSVGTPPSGAPPTPAPASTSTPDFEPSAL